MWENEFSYIGDDDRLRCLHGTPLFYGVNMFIPLGPPSVLGVWSMTIVLWLLL